LKEKVASRRERERERQREREIKRDKERERENTSIELHRERFAGRLEQIFRDGGESECRGGRGGFSERRERSHIHHHLFVYIETTHHLEERERGRQKRTRSLIQICYRQQCQDSS